jgi:NADH dehydrogenase FAD-containing subunit
VNHQEYQREDLTTMTSTKTTVVIIGASFAGAPIAHSLLKDVTTVKVILINPSPTFYFSIAGPRIMAKPTAFRPEQYLIPIESAFKKYPSESFEFVQGRVTAINTEDKSVMVDGQTSIQFDYLVIAAGSTTPSTTRGDIPIPFKQSNADNMATLIKNAQQAISSASQIVIAGAGPIGVELAGEIAEAARDQGKSVKVTLVSASDRVLPMLKASGSKAAESLLTQKNVTIISSHAVTDAVLSTNGTWNLSLSNGKQLTADLFIPTTGVVPNSSFIPQQWLDTDGWVKVDQELRVQDGQNAPLRIYAAGDITNNSMRLSFKAAEQAVVVAANIKNDILGSKYKRRVYDQGDSIMMIVPVGASGGTGQLFGMTPWSFMVKAIKGKDFFVSKAASIIGAS